MASCGIGWHGMLRWTITIIVSLLLLLPLNLAPIIDDRVMDPCLPPFTTIIIIPLFDIQKIVEMVFLFSMNTSATLCKVDTNTFPLPQYAPDYQQSIIYQQQQLSRNAETAVQGTFPFFVYTHPSLYFSYMSTYIQKRETAVHAGDPSFPFFLCLHSLGN